MFEFLLAYFEKRFAFTEKDVSLMQSVFVPKKLKKGEFLYQAGEIAKQEVFVASGILRRYVIDNKGKEHIVQFAPENWWVRDEKGFYYQEPTEFYVDAIEDASLLQIDQAGHLTLMAQISGYGPSFQAALQKNVVAKEKRILQSLVSTAEERYHDFLQTYPSIVQRVPQHMVAAYLGITPETLSRVRSIHLKK
ncbi:MAG TPA: Crp/Fnr family transcriptional regulator [Chitinophagales bacterium]|nr:Crp/Fnr family transcriptional regulator [Chitinophagales bacterium]